MASPTGVMSAMSIQPVNNAAPQASTQLDPSWYVCMIKDSQGVLIARRFTDESKIYRKGLFLEDSQMNLRFSEKISRFRTIRQWQQKRYLH